MKKFTYFLIILCIGVIGSYYAYAMSDYFTKSWRFKTIVTVETPEGEIVASAVREMANSTPLIDLPDVGNPASIKGEAVVVDLGKRGVFFVLVSDLTDNEFYNAFPIPGKNGTGGSTPEGIRYYASLPIGAKGVLDPRAPPGYPKLVMFKDMSDPLSVVQIQEWERVFSHERGKNFKLEEDRMEELFGEGVKLKSITIEITDEPIEWGKVQDYLSWLEKLNGGYLHGKFTSKGSPLGLHAGNFKIGEPK